MRSSIRSRSERWRLFALLLVLWGLAPRLAVGAELTEEAKAQARAKFNDGNAAYAEGDFRKALAAFEAAYQLAPLPGFLFNVAQCHRQLGEFARAASAYRRYLTLSEKEPANAAMVRELIAEMDAEVKQQSASRVAPGKRGAEAKKVAKVRPEAAPAPKAPEARAEAKKERTEAKKERVEPKDAARKALDIRTSRSLSASAKKNALPPAAVPGATAREAQEPLTRKWWVWAGAGAAVVLAGGLVYAIAAPEPRPTTLGTIPGR